MTDRKVLFPDWSFVSDRVMGGVSGGSLSQNGAVARLTGRVSLDNNGGFVQMAFDLAEASVLDASDWRGVAIETRGNGEVYDLRLRTDQLTRPWQSFRNEFLAGPDWDVHAFDFRTFAAHRTDAVLDPARLRRIGVLAIGREFEADVSVRGIWFFR